MSENGEHASLMDNLTEKFEDFSSSSDSDDDMPSTVFSTKKSLFGGTDPLHVVLGGGKAADMVLWRNKLVSGALFAAVTVIWLLFELIGYPLITFLCHSLMLLLAISFVWCSTASLTNRSPPKFPEVILPDDIFLRGAQYVTHQMNEAIITFCYIGSGKDSLVFVKVIAGLWLFSVIGSCTSFLTFSYIVFVLAHTVPVIYETYQDPIDRNWDRFIDESKNQWTWILVKIKEALKKIACHLKYE